MSIAHLVRRLAEAGATPEVIAIAVEAVEAERAAMDDRRAKDAARKKRSRDNPRTVTGQSADGHGTLTDIPRPPGSPRPSPAPLPTPLNPPTPAVLLGAREVAELVCEIAGADGTTHAYWHLIDAHAARWLASGSTADDVLAGVRAAMASLRGRGQGPPSNPSYFDGPIADATAARSAPMPQGTRNGHRPRFDPETATAERRAELADIVAEREARSRQRHSDGADDQSGRMADRSH